jgi:hypothetical protein
VVGGAPEVVRWRVLAPPDRECRVVELEATKVDARPPAAAHGDRSGPAPS